MSVYDIVTERIIENLKAGVVPWKRGWAVEFPRNFITKQPYRGINVILTSMAGYKSPDWLTFKQAKSIGLSIKKGEKANIIVFFADLKDKEKMQVNTEDEIDSLKKLTPIELKWKASSKKMLRYYQVYNLEQTDFKFPKGRPKKITMPIACEKIIEGWLNKPEIIVTGSEASYSIIKDTIKIPSISKFTNYEEYYSALYHEAIHSTGHSKRLNRFELKSSSMFGTELYSKEELVAEIGSSFLCDIAGISSSVIDNQSAYIDSWLKTLDNDRTLVFKAAAQAQLAVDYILEHQVRR